MPLKSHPDSPNFARRGSRNHASTSAQPSAEGYAIIGGMRHAKTFSTKARIAQPSAESQLAIQIKIYDAAAKRAELLR